MDTDSSIQKVVEFLVETVEWLACRDGVFRDLCPHCAQPFEVLITDLNCCIFRHGIFRATGQLVPPHASKDQCDRWLAQQAIWGCGKPFRFYKQGFEICDYI